MEIIVFLSIVIAVVAVLTSIVLGGRRKIKKKKMGCGYIRPERWRR